MSFNEEASLDTSQVEGGGGKPGDGTGSRPGEEGGREGGGAGKPGGGGGADGPGGLVVGGGVGAVLVLLLAILFGGNLTGDGTGSGQVDGGGGSTDTQVSPGRDARLDPAQVQPGGAQPGDLARCRTGADANRDVQCRVVATVNSLQDYWTRELPRHGKKYRKVPTVMYSGVTESACGTASNQVGPFYCSRDKKVYLDASFFAELTSRFGADSGAMAQEYIVAHEYGHAIQDQLGIISRAEQSPQGRDSGSVRIELMADCLGGVWAKHAGATMAANGMTFMKAMTPADIKSALSAASAVGDDRIQEMTQGRVTPESWTHGSSASRQKWFTTGYRSGDVKACDTFTAATLD